MNIDNLNFPHYSNCIVYFIFILADYSRNMNESENLLGKNFCIINTCHFSRKQNRIHMTFINDNIIFTNENSLLKKI